MGELKFLLKFGREAHVKDFIAGNLFCSNAITFWGIEKNLKIKGQGDLLEAGSRMFAQKMEMQEIGTDKTVATFGKSNGLVHYESAKKIPVFCLFSVYEEDCVVDDSGVYHINLSDEKRQQ